MAACRCLPAPSGQSRHGPQRGRRHYLERRRAGARAASGRRIRLPALRHPLWGCIDGKPAVLVSAPAGPGRKHGMVHIGLIDRKEGAAAPYTFAWNYHFAITGPEQSFAYSCLTQLPDDRIGILYEEIDQAQSVDTTRFEAISMETLLAEKDSL